MPTEHPEFELPDAERAYNDMSVKLIASPKAFEAGPWDRMINEDALMAALHDGYTISQVGGFHREGELKGWAKRVLAIVNLACDAVCTQEAEKVG